MPSARTVFKVLEIQIAFIGARASLAGLRPVRYQTVGG